LREAVGDIRYLRTLEWMLAQSQSAAAGRIRAMLAGLRESIPQGKFVRVAEGNEHDRVEVVAGPKYVEENRRRVAAWIRELLVAEPGGFKEIRPGNRTAANSHGQ
jgi:hypothetical protein